MPNVGLFMHRRSLLKAMLAGGAAAAICVAANPPAYANTSSPEAPEAAAEPTSDYRSIIGLL